MQVCRLDKEREKLDRIWNIYIYVSFEENYQLGMEMIYL